MIINLFYFLSVLIKNNLKDECEDENISINCDFQLNEDFSQSFQKQNFHKNRANDQHPFEQNFNRGEVKDECFHGNTGEVKDDETIDFYLQSIEADDFDDFDESAFSNKNQQQTVS